jgi:demethylmenaquinone methyltransferase/2-methoxy-6-polyprenyl-1,4-benzoquinol methylase|tara:strand:- start:1798 stop:2592 length:795 start_codon:yes stop_codon:yes gene_type:complete
LLRYFPAMSKHQGPAAGETGDKTTHFGFRDVPENQKASMVREVFDTVASKYDVMNDLMSGGIHRLWKDSFINELKPRPDMRLIDVAGGTGDIAFRFLKRGGGAVTVCDINYEMLHVGRDRAANHGLLKNIDWMVGDAQKLPLPDQSMDAYTIAFGIRNVTRVDEALREAYRVLKPGGRFLCLEFSKVVVPGFDKIYDLYSFKLLPEIGRMVAGNREAYQYLAESIRQFPDQETFAQMIRDAGFGRVRYRNLSGGIAAIHSGWRI